MGFAGVFGGCFRFCSEKGVAGVVARVDKWLMHGCVVGIVYVGLHGPLRFPLYTLVRE